jgi:hypothetical protein
VRISDWADNVDIVGPVAISSYEALFAAEIYDAFSHGSPLRARNDHVQIHFFDLVVIMYFSSRTFVDFLLIIILGDLPRDSGQRSRE